MPNRSTRSRTQHSGPQQLSTPPETPASSDFKASKNANSSRKRKPPTVKQEISGKNDASPQLKQDPSSEPPKKRGKSSKKMNKRAPTEQELQAGAEMAEHFMAARDDQRDETPTSSSQRSKANPYGFSPGETPYPTYPHPTPEECRQVNRLLQKAHGHVEAPKTIPTPSLNSSGCGEVPSVLDALIRTRLSAATNNANSSRAFRGLVERFGIIKEGVGKGSVNWEKVRKANIKDVYEAIKSGGLADVKSRDIQKILNLVHEEMQERKVALQKGEADKANDAPESEPDKVDEIRKAEHAILSLDHLHLLNKDDAFNKLLSYPGIGPKTASCVLLFCMQRPSFAVDTHVFRLTRWLGWAPSDQAASGMHKRGETKSKQVTRETAYAHLDVRVPDDLKYPLHYLLIRHGKHCGWCSAKAGKDSKVGTCPLAHLMRGKGRSKGLGKKKEDEGDEEGSDSVDDDPNVKEEALEEDMHS